MKTRHQILSALLVLALVASARAEKFYFLCKNAIDPARLLPAPPAANSDEGRAELDFLLAMQAKRTPELIARCQAEVNLDMSLFQGVMGPWFTAKNLPKLESLLRKAGEDGEHFVNVAKRHFNRQRPAQEDPRIHWAVTPHNSLAYPSGHSAWGTLNALILAEVAPERRAAPLERGQQIGGTALSAGPITTATWWPGGSSGRPSGRSSARTRSF